MQVNEQLVSSTIQNDYDPMEMWPSPTTYNNIIDTIGKSIKVSSISNSPAYTFRKDPDKLRYAKLSKSVYFYID